MARLVPEPMGRGGRPQSPGRTVRERFLQSVRDRAMPKPTSMKIPFVFLMAAAAAYPVACSSGNPTASGSAGSGGASSGGASGKGGGSGQGGAGAAAAGGTGGRGSGGAGAAGGIGDSGGRGGAGGTGGRGGAAGGGAATSGSGGSAGAPEYTCPSHGGMCVGNNGGSTACPNGWLSVGGLTCPINESNAVVGVHCCMPQVSRRRGEIAHGKNAARF